MRRCLAVFLLLAACGGSDDSLRDAAPVAPACAPTLARAADFDLRFLVQVPPRAGPGIARQRERCDASRDFWDVRLNAAGSVNVEMNQGGPGPSPVGSAAYASVDAAHRVDDGALHQVVVRRSSGSLAVWVDGRASATAVVGVEFRSLPEVAVGAGGPCEGPATISAIVSGLCIEVLR